MNAPVLGLRDLVHQRRREERFEFEAQGAAVARPAIGPALFTDVNEIGVDREQRAGGAHAAKAAFHVPNEN
ncbi:MAG: hypothetical protein AB7F84_09810 [Hyphomonadaceae bacterium]